MFGAVLLVCYKDVELSTVVMYYTIQHFLQKCLIDVVHHYSYPSARFDENYTSVQFVETILWLSLMELYVFFKLMVKMCVYTNGLLNTIMIALTAF